ncbi:MAG: UDP-3-O-[3-hydroxymyristoyl] glucosamine N-acyltransferase [Myxococcota bacterium]|jgi:UDP-3-O-[3-hydroxymyristoyl] glucosamine N-acyltransferase
MQKVSVALFLSLFGTAYAADSNGDGCDDVYEPDGTCVSTRALLGPEVSIGSSVSIAPYASLAGRDNHTSNPLIIADGVVVGRRVTIGVDHMLGTDTTIGRIAEIGADLTTLPDATIGYAAVLGHHVTLQTNAIIGSLVQLGNYTTVGPNAILARSCVVADSVDDASGSVINGIVGPNSTIGGDVHIDAGARIRKQADIRTGARVTSTARIGRSARVGEGSIIDGTVRANAFVGAGVTIDAGATVGRNASVCPGTLIDGATVVGSGASYPDPNCDLNAIPALNSDIALYDSVRGQANVVRLGASHLVVAYSNHPDASQPASTFQMKVIEVTPTTTTVGTPQTFTESVTAPTSDASFKLMGAMGDNYFILIVQHDGHSDSMTLYRRDGMTITRLNTLELPGRDWYSGHPMDDDTYVFRYRYTNSGTPVYYRTVRRTGDSISFGPEMQRPAPSSFPGLGTNEPQTPGALVRIGTNTFREIRGGYVWTPGYLSSWVLTVAANDTLSASQLQVHSNSATKSMTPSVVGNGTGEAIVMYGSYNTSTHTGHFTSSSSSLSAHGVLSGYASAFRGQSRDSEDGYHNGKYYMRNHDGTLYRFNGVSDTTPDIVETGLSWRMDYAPMLLELQGRGVFLVSDLTQAHLEFLDL